MLIDEELTLRTEVDLAEVRDETFITLTQGFATHQDGNRVFKQAGFAAAHRRGVFEGKRA